ncbi:VWA domain-containing protein [Larkinella arboricola]|uniref:Ca-activated chloride channel family protein n=1 Tax=Larkinella arboricola TaxID=643671 RepID=A0A327WZ97_LARAB|nr:VWA domain-containing protein [Larkinella arboricola]RAJ98056.1 Ca-activated chloride channel family protein [Larkinella arboricola]
MEWFSYQWFTISQLRQFTWAHPIYLYAIPGILLLFGLRTLLSGRAKQRLSVALNRAELQPTLVSSLRYLLPLSLFIALALIFVALARPQLIREQPERVAEGIDLMLAIDISSSMSETDLKPNRLEAAKRVARAFVKSRQNDRIGLVIFAGEAYSLCPLTTDHDLINSYLNDLDDSMIKTSGTAIGSALAVCINRMRESKVKSKVTILLSDGDNTAGNLDPVTVARLAKAFNIRIYTVAIGKPPRPSVISNLTTVTVDEGILTTIANIGSGSFFRAGDATRLQAVFNEIDRLEKAPIKTVIYKDVKDFYRVYLYWAIVFLLLTLLLKNTIFGNILED